MALSPVDRNAQFMYDNWGTISLITDYKPSEKKVIQEVVYDSEVKLDKILKKDLFETKDEDNSMNDFSYGVEPTYKIGTNQKLLRE